MANEHVYPDTLPFAAGRTYARTPVSSWVLFVLLFAAVSFNLFLCFANTNFMRVSNLHVITSEVVIISLVLLVSYRAISQVQLLLLGAIVLWALSLASIRVAAGTEGSLDVKIIRDLLIPFSFFLLGTCVSDLKAADRMMAALVAIVLAFALFEYFWVEMFTKLFSVAKYYIVRGTMEARQALQSADLFISGVRPAGAHGGRNLLPFLGDHRVSSIFLEPVSLGNFGLIAVMWALVRSKAEGRLYLGLLVAGLSLTVLADSRFGAYLCLVALVLMFLPLSYATVAVTFLPLAALALLVIVPAVVTGSYDPQHRYVDNGVLGRLVLSGLMLADFDVFTWLGLKPPRMQAFDSGYAYIISGIGILGAAFLWFLLFSIKGADQQFWRFRNLTAAYYGAILCISNSPFTIKTASVLWFLMGALAASRGPLKHSHFRSLWRET